MQRIIYVQDKLSVIVDKLNNWYINWQAFETSYPAIYKSILVEEPFPVFLNKKRNPIGRKVGENAAKKFPVSLLRVFWKHYQIY